MSANSPFSYKEYNLLTPTVKPNPIVIESHDQVNLAYYPFISKINLHNAVVIMYHGGGAYSTQAYLWVAEQLQQYGISTYCFDIRGHGHSQGPRGDAPSVKAVFDDIDVTIDWVQRNNPHKKIYLVGHSSGAGLLINYHHDRKDTRVSGYISLAPFLGPKANTSRYQGPHPQSFVKDVRTWVFIANALLPVGWFAHCNAVFFNYPKELLQSDPLMIDRYTYTMSSATTPYDIDTIMANWGNMPLWTFIGSCDEQFIPEAVIKVSSQACQESFAQVIDGVAHLSILKQAPNLIKKVIEASGKVRE